MWITANCAFQKGIINITWAFSQVRSRRTSIASHAKQTQLATVISSAIVALFLLAPTAIADQVSPTQIPWQALPVKAKSTPTPRALSRATWIDRLVQCESRGNPRAINPKDRDGTPSYGLLQFKPSTFASYARAYGMASTSNFMDPEAQRAIVLRMMRDPSVDWHLQFPVCVQRLGMPPGVVA